MTVLLYLHFNYCFLLNSQVATTSILWLSWEPVWSKDNSVFHYLWIVGFLQLSRQLAPDLLLLEQNLPCSWTGAQDLKSNSSTVILQCCKMHWRWVWAHTRVKRVHLQMMWPSWPVHLRVMLPCACSVPRLSIARAGHHLLVTHTDALQKNGYWAQRGGENCDLPLLNQINKQNKPAFVYISFN